MRVAACLVTRGNVPMDDILDSIPDDMEVIVWDNSKNQDLGVYGRYAAIAMTDAELIYVQDDDAVLATDTIQTLADTLASSTTLVANMPDRFRPHYTDSCLVGFGAVFHRDLPQQAFDRIPQIPADFNLVCDVYFTALTERHLLDLPHTDQPWASNGDRMWKQKNHVPMRAKALHHARTLR